MTNVIIINENKNSSDLLVSQLKNIGEINILNVYNDFILKSDEINDADIIFFDIASKTASDILFKIKAIKEQNSEIALIALSYEINSKLTAQTLEAGADDFLLKPTIAPVIEAAIKKIKKNKSKKDAAARVLSVFSNKAGAGKTSVAVNLAYEIAKKTNEKVCILDFSFNDEDVSTFLDIKPRFSREYILSKIENASEEMFLSLMSQYRNSNLYIFATKENLDFNFKPDLNLIVKIINAVKNIFSYIIIDTQSTINEVNLEIFNSSDLIFLIGLLNLASIRNCQKCCELFDNIGYNNDKIKLIVNRYIENSQITLDDVEKTVSKKAFQTIPNNYLTLIDAINQGYTVGEINPHSNIAKAYSALAQKVLDIDFLTLKLNTQKYNHGLLNLLNRMGE